MIHAPVCLACGLVVVRRTDAPGSRCVQCGRTSNVDGADVGPWPAGQDLGEFWRLIALLRGLDLAGLMAECGSSKYDIAAWRLISDIKDAIELHDQLVRDP